MTLIDHRPTATSTNTVTTTILAEVPALEPVTLDLYRDIHKGLRDRLFDITLTAGRLDPADGPGRARLAARVDEMVEDLLSHAEHEDGAIQPALVAELPELAERIAVEHELIDARMAALGATAAEAVAADAGTARFALHRTYVDLAAFVGDYLVHQDVEERVVMPALEAAVGVDAVVAIHGAIVGSIPPEDLAASLAMMLPAMCLDDRVEMLGGMRQGAPPEVFAGLWGLAGTVLAAPDRAALAARLGLD